MKILAFDCSSKTMAAVIGDGDTLLAEDFRADNRNHAPYLMPMIHGLLEKTGLCMKDIELIGVTVGPGSFTGLRIGIATAKGFADLLGVPVVPLCSIDVLAENYRDYEGLFVPILDARKSQVYAGVFRNHGGKIEKLMRETAISPLRELMEKLPETEPVLFFGDAVAGWRDKIESCYGSRCSFGDEQKNGICGEALLRLTAAAPSSCYTRDPSPVYLRGVDAKAKFTDYVIDAMNLKDIPELVELDKTCFPRPWSKKIFHDEMTNGYGHYWVIRSGGKVTAYGGFWLVDNECHITNIAVHADHRHTGQGRAMLEHIIAVAGLYGVRGITLEVRPSNETAVHLYESHGFQREGLRKKYYEDNGEDALIMWLRFPDPDKEKPWR